MKEPGKIEKALDTVGRNAVLRGFLQSTGVAGVIGDNLLLAKRDDLQRDRIMEFIEELDRQECNITGEQLERVDYCHATLVTVAAAARAARTEKVHLFARLLSNYDYIVTGNDVDAYEEMLRVLDDMSVREYQSLLSLRHYEQRMAQELAHVNPESGLAAERRRFAGGYWDDFVRHLERNGVAAYEVGGMLVRLRRTGFYDTLQGRESDNNFYGRTTPLFDRFVKAVERHEREHPASPPPDLKEDTAGRFHRRS